MVHPAFLIAAALVSASPVPPDQEPLRVAVVDATSFPTFTFDVITPMPLAATELTASMLSVGGLPVVSLTAIDPTTTAVALVVDDRSEVDEATVADQQAASVDLARNLVDGVELAVLTASGLRSALTVDDTAAIEPVGSIVAGAPDVVAVSDAVVEAANTLASSSRVDRHLVVLLGADLALEAAELDAVAAVVDSADVRIHVVAPSVDPGALADLAGASGGGAAVDGSHVAGVDAVAAAVGDRYRAVATTGVSGPQEVVLDASGQRFTTSVDVIAASAPVTTGPAAPPATSVPAADPAAPSTSALADSPVSPTGEPTVTTTAAVPSAVAESDSATATTAPTTSSDGGGGVNWLLVVLGLGIVVVGVSIAAAVLGAPMLTRRRRRAAARAAAPVVPEPNEAAEEPESAPAVEAATPASVEAAAAPVGVDEAPERTPIGWQPPPPSTPPAAQEDPAAEEEPVAEVPPAAEVPEPAEVPPAAEVAERAEATKPPPTPPAAEEESAVEVPEPAEAAEPPPEQDEAPPVVPVMAATPPPRERRRVERRPHVERPGRAAAPVSRPRRSQERTAEAVNGVDEDAGWLVRGALRMSVETGEVWSGRRRINLTEPETDVLWLLLTANGDEVSTESVLEAAGRPPTAGKRAADMVVARVKRRAGISNARARPARNQHTPADHHDHAE